MTREHARLTVLLDAQKKKEFDALCASLGTTASQVVRELVAGYLAGDKPQPLLGTRARGGKTKPGPQGTD